MGSAKGPDAIFKLMDDMIGHNPMPEGSGTYHLLSNENIAIDGDYASAVTKWVYITPDANGAPAYYLGHYNDHLFVKLASGSFCAGKPPWIYLRANSHATSRELKDRFIYSIKIIFRECWRTFQVCVFYKIATEYLS